MRRDYCALLFVGMLILGGCSSVETDANATRQTSDTRFTNNRPTGSPQTVTLWEDANATIRLEASDLDGDRLTYAIVTPPQHGRLQGEPPELVYMPDPDYYGEDRFVFTCSDGQIDSFPATVSIVVNPVNDAPVVTSDMATTDEDTPVSIAVLENDHDVDGDPLSVNLVSAPLHGTATVEGERIRYTPAADYHGTDRFSYQVHDGRGGEGQGWVELAVRSVNDAPIARAGVDRTIILSQNTLLDGRGSSDVDGDTLHFSWRQNGVSVSEEPTYVFEGNQTGVYTLTLTVSDPDGAVGEDNVTIRVTPPANETPHNYHDVFTEQPPVISTPSRITTEQDLRQIDTQSKALIRDTDTLIANEHLYVDAPPVSDADIDAIRKHKTLIEKEVNDYGN